MGGEELGDMRQHALKGDEGDIAYDPVDVIMVEVGSGQVGDVEPFQRDDAWIGQ